MALSVTIEGVDRTTKTRNVGAVSIEYQLGARARGSLEILDRDSFATAYRPAIDHQVEIRDGTEVLFNGEIQTVLDGPLGEPGVGTVTELEAVDFWVIAGNRRVNEAYPPGQTLRDVVTNLFDIYLGPGVHPTFDLALGPMDPGPVLPALTFDFATVEDVFNTLSEHSTWVYRLIPAGIIEWFPVGGKLRPITFSTANKNITGAVRWTRSRDIYTNRLFLRFGTVSIVEKRDDWVGDGAWTTRDPTYPSVLFSTMVVNEDGVAHPLGVWGVDANLWTYELYGDPRGRVSYVRLHRASPAPVGAAVWFAYNVQFPLVCVSYNEADIALNGVWELLEEAPEIFDVAQAQAQCDALLRRYQGRPREIEFSTATPMRLLPGDSVTVDLPERTLPAATWLVTAVRLDVDGRGRTTSQLTLLEGLELQASWVDYWRKAVGTTSGTGSGTASGASVPGTSAAAPDLGGGSYFLGASAVEWVQSPVPVGWIPAGAIQITPRRDMAATVTVRLRARAGSVSARLHDVTANQTVGSGNPVTSAAFVTTSFGVAVTAGHTYELQLLPTIPGVDVQGIGVME